MGERGRPQYTNCMALPNPSDQRSANPAEPGQPGQVIAQWQEPATPSLLSRLPNFKLILLGGILVIAALIALSVWLKDLTYALAAGVVVSAGSAVISQNRRVAPPIAVEVSTTRLTVGARQYPLSDLAGFWLEPSPTALAVHVEPSRGTAVPITFLYPNTNIEECRELLLEVLSEVEPRTATANDKLNRWMGL